MRNVVIFLNLRTNKKIALSNRKLAWQLYEKINLAEQQKYIQYARFAALILKGPLRFLDYEVSWVPMNSPQSNLDELYKLVVSFEPATVVREKVLHIDAGKAIPIDLTSTTHRPESGNEQTAPVPES